MIHDPINQRPLVTHEWLVRAFREAIIHGQLVPGQAIRQDEFAQLYGVSRMPVREALRTLGAEGWVEIIANRGAFVVPLDPDDALELFEARAALEAVAARHSIPRLTEAQLAKVNQAHQALHKAHRTDYFDAHRGFHLALYAAASSRLQRTVSLHIDASRRYIAFETEVLDVDAVDREEHQRMRAAALAHDGEAVAALMSQHIAQAGRDIAAQLRDRIQTTGDIAT